MRLASKLIGWHIDIKSEEEKRREIEAQMAGMLPGTPRTPLEELAGLGDKTKEKLGAAGVGTVEELAAMTPEQLTAIPGIGEKMVQKIAAVVKQHFEPESAPAPEPEATPAQAAEKVPGAEPRSTEAAPGEEPRQPETETAPPPAAETSGEDVSREKKQPEPPPVTPEPPAAGETPSEETEVAAEPVDSETSKKE